MNALPDREREDFPCPAPHPDAEHGIEEDGAPLAPAPVLVHGDAAEDATAYAQLRHDLAQHYGVRGPLESLLLDRVASLAWRLQRIPKMERGLVTLATLGLFWSRATDRLRESRTPALGLRGSNGAALSTNPHRLAGAVEQLQSLHDQVAHGPLPSESAARVSLTSIFGASFDGTPHGIGATLLQHLDGLREADASSEVRTSFLANAQSALTMMTGLREVADQEAHHGDLAALEARLLPGERPLRALERYERHLQRELLGAVRELERTIARKRLCEATRARSVWG